MALTQQELITRLIKDDLTNYRLVMGLDNLGLVPEQYFLHVSEIIFTLMGIEAETDLEMGYAHYENMKGEILNYELENTPEKLDELADTIYRELVYRKLLQESKK